jgi:hypothetical protein
MAIGFTAERSHYRSGSTYAILATIPTPAVHDSAALIIGQEIFPNPCKGHICPPGKKCIISPAGVGGFTTPVAGCIEAPISCPSGYSACYGYDGTQQCLNLKENSANCGYCGNWCDPDQHCSGGVCECNSGTNCGTVNGVYYGCTDLSSDPSNCGGCGIQCPSGVCVNGACCPPEQVCNGVCCPVGGPCAGCASGDICANGMCCPPLDNPFWCGEGGRYSNSNYFFANGDCQPITGLTVSLTATTDIVASGAWTMQLNACSQQGLDSSQQYAFRIDGDSIVGIINNWENSATAIVYGGVSVGGTQVANTLPAGCTLQIALQYTGTVVSGAVFTTLCNGEIIESKPLSVSDAGCTDLGSVGSGHTCIGYQSPADLSAITAFQLNIVGPGGGNATTFTGGSGNIVYTVSDGALTPSSNPPGCVANSFCTDETSNATYGELNSCSAQSLTQSFGIASY